MAAKAKPVAKKVAAKKTTTVKPVAKKAAAKTAEGAKASDAAKVRETKRAESVARREGRDKERDATIADITRLRSEGQKWNEVADSLGISIGKAQLLFKIGEARTAGVRKPTPALVRKDRDEGQKSWDEIAVSYGLTKSGAQKLYKESGGDPHKSYVGKGGRYFSHEADIAPLRAANKKVAAPKAAKATPVAKAAPGKPVFNEDADAEIVKAKLSGKTITSTATIKGTESVKEFKVKPESIKVGKSKDQKTRVVQFTNAETGGTHTIHLSSITKVSR